MPKKQNGASPESSVGRVPRVAAVVLLGGAVVTGSIKKFATNETPKDRVELTAQSRIIANWLIPLGKISREDQRDVKAATTTTLPATTTTQPPPTFTSAEIQAATTLSRIGGCESGGSPTAPINYHAQNPTSTASGGFQFLDTTWNNFDGYPRALDAPPEIQTEKAFELYEEEGTSPWDASRGCWG